MNLSKSASWTNNTLVSNELCRVRAEESSFASRKVRPNSLGNGQHFAACGAPRHSLLPDVAKIHAFVQTNDKIRLILLIQTCEDQRQTLLFASPADADARDPVT